MEEASKAKKAKKGFMTPERKKKLRVSRIEMQNVNCYTVNSLPTHSSPPYSCCCVKKPLKSWRKNRNAKQPNVDASSKKDAASQRTSKTPTKVAMTCFNHHTPLTSSYSSPVIYFTRYWNFPKNYLLKKKKKKEKQKKIPPQLFSLTFSVSFEHIYIILLKLSRNLILQFFFVVLRASTDWLVILFRLSLSRLTHNKITFFPRNRHWMLFMFVSVHDYVAVKKPQNCCKSIGKWNFHDEKVLFIKFLFFINVSLRDRRKII